MRIIGLTGGIASGKSTVKELLQERGIPIVEYNTVAVHLLRKGNDGLKGIVKVFGEDILRPDGELDRVKCGNRIFRDPEASKKFHAEVWTATLRGIVWEVLKQWFAGTKVLVLDIPNLFETGMDKFLSSVIVVWVDPETQEERLIARGLSSEQAQSTINSESSLDSKRELADIVIDNSGAMEETELQVDKVVNDITGPSTYKELLGSRDFVGGLLALACFAGVCKLWARTAT